MTGEVRSVEPVDVPKPPGNFVHGIVVPAGMEMMFVSGQTPDELDGTVPIEFADQARVAWRNVTRTLTAGGFALADVVKVTMYIRDRGYREDNRTVRNEVLGDLRPALTVLVTDHWDERWLIEIEVVAARRV